MLQLVLGSKSLNSTDRTTTIQGGCLKAKGSGKFWHYSFSLNKQNRTCLVLVELGFHRVW